MRKAESCRFRVCQVKCVNLFDFFLAVISDRHFGVRKSTNQTEVLHRYDRPHIEATYHVLLGTDKGFWIKQCVADDIS